MKKSVIALLVIGMLAIAGTSMAATATSNINVTANVLAVCNISSVNAVAFGSYDPTAGSPNDAGQGSMIFTCTKDTSYRTYITGTRTMSNGTDSLTFQLFTDAGRTTAFLADNSGSPTTAANTNPITTNIYGRIAAGQNVGVGNYTATLVATVDY